MKKRLALLLILTLGFVFLSGCGGSPASLTSTVPPVRTLNVGVSLSPGTAQGMDQGQQMSFTAAVANDSNGQGVIWTVTGGGTLSDATATSVTYNAPTSGSSSVTVTLTATSVADSTKKASVAVTVAPPLSVPAPSTAILTGTTGTPYSLTLQASGGTAPFTWSLASGNLPTGLTLSSAGVISGTPTGSGTASLIVQVKDSAASPVTATTKLTLTVNTPPAITTQPANQTVTAGQTATFSVTTTGTAPLSYQWSKNGTAISGTNSTSYTTPATTAADSGATYAVAVSNIAGSVTSNPATLTVNIPPAITTQPANQTVTAGHAATFNVTATGTAPLSYQWSKNGIAISGANSSSYTLPATIMADSGSAFTVAVDNAFGNVTSNAAILTVNPLPPTISKSFGAASIPLAGTTSLSFTVNNPNTTTLTGIAFSDALPAGLIISTPNGLAGSCGGGTVTATQATNVVSLSSASLAASGSCTFSVNVTGTAAGDQNNTTGNVTSTEGGSGGTASASIKVVTPPLITEAFGATAIPVSTTTSLTFTITNSAANTVALTGVAFSDTLPTGLTVANSSASVCGGTRTTTAPTGIALTGATIAVNSTCQFSVMVTGAAGGNYTNTTAVTSTNAGTGNTASANLTVNAAPQIIASFGAASIPLNGTTSLSFTISNPNTSATLTGIGFSDTLPAGLVISTPNGLTGTCGGGTITATQGTNVISLSGASVAASGSCTFSVNVTGTAAGTQINTTGNVTSTEGGTGGTASASMAVVAPPLLAVTFNPTSIALNATSSLTFTITNPAANTAALMGVAFSDTLPTGLTVVNSSATVCGGTLTTAAPTGISLLGATVAINSQCQFSVTVTGAVIGNYSNMVNGAGTITSTNGGTGVASNTANLAVVAPPTIFKVFDAFTIPLNGTTFLTFTINNPNSSVTLNGVAFTDNLPAGLVVATPGNLNNTCGATATATDGSGSVSLTGASLAAGALCQVWVKVTGTTAGVKDNSVTVSSTNGGTGNTSNASVTVVVPQSIFAFFGAASIPLNGTTLLSFTIRNPNTSATLTGIGFSDTLPAGLVISTPNGLTGTCVRGTITATQGTNVISLSGASVAASDSCTFSVNVTGTAAGTQINTTGNVTSTEGGTGGTASASIVVVAPTFQVSGNVSWLNGGGNGISGVMVSINTSPAQNTTTDNNGNFNFAAVPNGTYTIAPSITGPSSIFLPSSLQVTVNGANISNENFQGQLGYTVSGTVNYGGALTGRIYLQLQSTSNFCTTSGTSVAAAGASFTIQGVCPGTYTLTAWMDNLGYGAQNASNPTGNVVVTVSTTDVLGQTVTLNDPAPVDISTSTTGFKGVFGTTNGAMAMIKPVTNNLGEETATNYTIQWSADSTFNTGVNSHTFGAIGEGGNGGDKPYILSATNGLTGLSGMLYFRIQAANATSQTIWTNYASNPVTIGAPTGANTISGTVSFADTAIGPMYAGCFDQNTSIIYATVTDTPMSPQAYSVSGVPTGANCFIFGIVDQNSDGIIDAGDISNTDSGGNSGVTISGNLTQNITLPSTNATATVTTHHSRTAGQSGDWYALNFDVRGSIRMPVALELTAGPNVLVPVDVAKNSSKGFNFWPNLGGVRPTLGDTYNLGVVYSDNLPETLQPAVTGVSDAFAQNMSVTGGATPTFSWSAPTNPPASYTYQFRINDNNGNQIWQVPGNNSNSSGLSSSVTSLTWNSDPTDLNNHPTVPNLSIGVTYQWTITVTDRDGNSAQMQQSYTP